MSGVRSIVRRLTPLHRTRFAALAHSPAQFQQWIAGHDVRVHVVGRQVFPRNVVSSAIDYRYPRSEEEVPRITPCCLPEEIALRCCCLAASLGLHCFEVNPSPAFTFYAEATEQPIEHAVAALLAQGAQV